MHRIASFLRAWSIIYMDGNVIAFTDIQKEDVTLENRPHSRLILKFNYFFKNLNLFILFCYPYLSQVMKKWCKNFQGNIFLSLVGLNSMLSGSSLFCNSANNFIYQLFYHIKNLIKAHNLSSKRQHVVVCIVYLCGPSVLIWRQVQMAMWNNAARVTVSSKGTTCI